MFTPYEFTMFDTCSVLSRLTPGSLVDCPTSVSMKIAHCTVDMTDHVTKSKDRALF